jgi:hypothetical protein
MQHMVLRTSLERRWAYDWILVEPKFVSLLAILNTMLEIIIVTSAVWPFKFYGN